MANKKITREERRRRKKFNAGYSCGYGQGRRDAEGIKSQNRRITQNDKDYIKGYNMGRRVGRKFKEDKT